MLVEKDVIGPGTVWYNDLKTGEPRKSVVTPERVKYWHDRGNEMLAAGLTVPVPCEHDFQATPMTPAEKLLNNAGWVKEYKIKDSRLVSVIDVPDEKLAQQLPTTVKWTSPWFSTFTDGTGKKWENVISHLALTTRPRVVDQAPFPSVAAAIGAAQEYTLDVVPEAGFALSLAGLFDGEKPADEAAFSQYAGVALASDPEEDDDEEAEEEEGYYKKLLMDLLKKLNVPMPEIVTEDEMKNVLAQAAELKIKELTSKRKTQPSNPIVQEQQPMYMTLEDIQKIPDEVSRGVADRKSVV